MPPPRRKPLYIVIEYEEQNGYDNAAAAEAEAISAHERERHRGFAVVEVIRIITSEHKTQVKRLR